MQNKTKSRKKRKIVIQIGVITIILFALVTIAVGNMVTMSSFSTALSSNMTMFEYYMGILADNTGEYKALTWLMDYWKANADTLFPDQGSTQGSDDISDILKKLSAESSRDVTAGEAGSLSPDEQRRFAIAAYKELQTLFRMYQDENEDVAILLTLKAEDEEEPVLILANAPEDEVEENLLGRTGNIRDIRETIDNTEVATEASVWKWAFTTPGKMMLFGISVPFSQYKGSSKAEMLGVFSAELVYGDMRHTDGIRNGVIVMMLAVLGMILAALYYIVPRPLEKVKECVSEYSENKDTEALVNRLSSIRSGNEIGALADEFSSMAFEMERYTHEMEVLAVEKERVATELNVATNIQMQMLPRVFPEREELGVFASSVPAKEVGGDFYDCYMTDDDHLALIIADVSGKGVPAALFMAVSKTMLKNRTVVGGTPGQILHDVNNWLCEGNDSCMFVTVWLGILTISTGELVTANAGHEYPGIRSGNKGFRLIRSEHGSPLGLMENMEYQDEHYQLSHGDAVFVYTDGVTEANAEDESIFGEERLQNVLSEIGTEDTPEVIVSRVKDAVKDFSGSAPQFDDITMLCLVMN